MRHRGFRRLRYARHERQQQIYRYAVEYGDFTVSEIAAHLDVSPSQHLRQIIWDMVDDGRLIAWPRQHWNGWPKWVFEIHKERVGDE